MTTLAGQVLPAPGPRSETPSQRMLAPPYPCSKPADQVFKGHVPVHDTQDNRFNLDIQRCVGAKGDKFVSALAQQEMRKDDRRAFVAVRKAVVRRHGFYEGRCFPRYAAVVPGVRAGDCGLNQTQIGDAIPPAIR